MRVIEVRVSYGTTFNDRHEQFRNHRIQMEMAAVIDDGESPGNLRDLLYDRLKENVDARRAEIHRRADLMATAEADLWKAREFERQGAYAAETADKLRGTALPSCRRTTGPRPHTMRR